MNKIKVSLLLETHQNIKKSILNFKYKTIKT